MKLTAGDLHHVLTRVPKDILKLIKEEKVILGGGFIREVVAGSQPNDIDLFGSNADTLQRLAARLGTDRQGRTHVTDNAVTVIAHPRLPVQFITRWCFENPLDVVASFDFTVCQAVIWFDQVSLKFESSVANTFYSDLAARRLVYTSPRREEAVGGSLLRVRKFLQRGYTIQASSLAGVIARLVKGVENIGDLDEQKCAFVISGLLHEVDPLLVIDGCEPRNDHDPIEQQIADAS